MTLSYLRLLSRPTLLLSLADLLPSRSGHLPAAFPRCCDFRHKFGSRPARSLAKRRRHSTLAARCAERREIATDRSYLRLKFFDSGRGTDPSEFLELRCSSWHIGADHIHNSIAGANSIDRRRKLLTSLRTLPGQNERPVSTGEVTLRPRCHGGWRASRRNKTSPACT